MSLQQNRGQNRTNTFKCAKISASFALTFLACAASGLLLAFWMLKSNNGFNTCPYIISTGCYSAYFSLKYKNQLLPLIILIAILTSTASLFVNLILSLTLLVRKTNPTPAMRTAKCLLSSTAGLASTISLGYTASFLFQLPRIASYGCTVNYETQNLIILCSAAAALLLLILIELLMVATIYSDEESEPSNKVKQVNDNYLTDQSEDLFAPPLSKRERILRNRTVEGKKLEQLRSFQENTSFAELRNGNESVGSKLASVSLESNGRKHWADAGIQESLFKARQKQQKMEKVSWPVDRLKSTSLKVYPQLYQVQREDSELTEQTKINPARLSFIPEQSFAYPRQDRSSNHHSRRSPDPLAKSSLFPSPYYHPDTKNNASPLSRNSDAKDGVDRARMVGQIQRNYERRLNALSPPSK